MKKGIHWFYATFLFTLFSIFAQSCYAMYIDKIIVFGDSLSDNGNIFTLTKFANEKVPLIPIIPKDPPYFQGRFSNGPIWVDNLAEELNVDQINYAYGGSWAEPLKDSKFHVPFGLGMQVNFYLVTSALDFYKENHLYIIWSGANDYIGGRSDPEYSTTNTVESIQSNIEWLIYYGAKNILVINVPDLGVVPQVRAKGPDFAMAATRLAKMHNEKFATMIQKEREANPEVKIVLADVQDYFSDLIANPEKYHLKNVTQGCYDGGYWLKLKRFTSRELQALEAAKKANIDILSSPSLSVAYVTAQNSAAGERSCANPDEYLFWDQIHPTRVVHEMISATVLDLLNTNGMNKR